MVESNVAAAQTSRFSTCEAGAAISVRKRTKREAYPWYIRMGGGTLTPLEKEDHCFATSSVAQWPWRSGIIQMRMIRSQRFRSRAIKFKKLEGPGESIYPENGFLNSDLGSQDHHYAQIEARSVRCEEETSTQNVVQTGTVGVTKIITTCAERIQRPQSRVKVGLVHEIL